MLKQETNKQPLKNKPKVWYKKVENVPPVTVDNILGEDNKSVNIVDMKQQEVTIHSEKVQSNINENTQTIPITQKTKHVKKQEKNTLSNSEKKYKKEQNFKNIKTLSPDQRQGLDNLLISFNDDHETNLILFLNNYMRMFGKDFNKEYDSADVKSLKNNLRQNLPKSMELFNEKFIAKNKDALCDASIVGNLYISKKQSLLYVPNVTEYAPYFFKLYLFDVLRKNIRIVNLYQNKPCTSIGMFAHYNYIGMPRAKFYDLVKQIVTNEFRDHFHYSVIASEKTDNLSMWDIHAYNFLQMQNQSELKEGELIDNLPLMELKNRLVIIQHMNEMSQDLWNIFLNDGKFPFIFDTEWNFFDPQETGVRVIQVANSFVCFMILVDFEEKPADYLVDFLFNPKYTKIGFALNGDLKRINNWLTKHNMENLERTFVNTPDYMNNQFGWIEGDPFSVGLSKLVTFHTFSNQKTFYKFKGILEFYEYKWNPYDLNPTLTHCLKRIDYASMDVLIGYYYLKCEKYPSNHLFNANLRKGWTQNTWKEEAKKSKEIKYSLLEIIYSDRSTLFTTKTRHFKMKVAYTKNFWKVNENLPNPTVLETETSESNHIKESAQPQEETVDEQK